MYADQESRSRQQAGSRARIHTLIRSPLLCRNITGLVCRARSLSSLNLPAPRQQLHGPHSLSSPFHLAQPFLSVTLHE